MAKNKSAKTITVTNGILISDLHPAIHTLGALNIKSIDTLMKIVKFRKAVQQQLELYSEAHKSISEANCEKDKTGRPVFETVMTQKGPQQMYKYKTAAISEEVTQRLSQLNDKKVEIEFESIKSTDLKNVEGLNANTIAALGDFIELV